MPHNLYSRIDLLTSEIHADVGDYPSSHIYMFYTDSSNVTPEIHSALDSMSDCSGRKVSEMMAKLVKALDKATAGSRHNPVDIDDPDPMVIDSDDPGKPASAALLAFKIKYPYR